MKRFALVLAALVLFVYFFGLGSYALIDPDEGRYAEIAREMLESGDYVTPRLNYVKYFEKPVLHYWMTAISFGVLGQNEFAARLAPVLCALGGIGLTFMLGRQMWGFRSAVYAAAILSTSLLWFAIARLNILDMTVSFFITLSVAGFWMGTRNASPGDRRYLFLFYVGMALATLSKGLIGIVLPGGIAFWYILLTRRWKLIARSLYCPGIAVFFLLAVPWFWAVCRVNDDFFHFFFVQEHLLRYMTQIHDRYEPFWYFVPVLIGGLMPWAGLLPDMFRMIFFADPQGRLSEKAGITGCAKSFFLGIWFAVPFVFFSLSSSKLVPYIVPCLPPLALLGGRALTLIADGNGKHGKCFAVLNGILLLLTALVGVVYSLMDNKLGSAVLLPYTLPAVFSLLALAFACGWFYFRGAYKMMVDACCVLAFVNVVTFSQGFALKAGLDSYKAAAAQIREHTGTDDVVVVGYRDPVQGLGFYLKRRIVLAEYFGELRFGALQEKDPRWFIDGERLKSLWDGPTRVFLVLDGRRIKDLEQLLGRSAKEIWRSANDAVLVNF